MMKEKGGEESFSDTLVIATKAVYSQGLLISRGRETADNFQWHISI